MSGHALLAPSKASRWLACPGSIHLEVLLALIEEPSTFVQREGTGAHNFSEDCLNLEMLPEDLIGSVYEGDILVDYTMASHIEAYIAYVYEVVPVDQRTDILVEHRSPLFYDKESGGTADVVWYNKELNELHVFDLKYGQNVFVEVDDNPQLLIYGISVIKELGLEGATLHIHVCQPRMQNFATQSFDVTDWEDIESQISVVAEGILTAPEKQPFNPGEKQCRWCPSNGNCTAQTKALLVGVADEFEDLDNLPATKFKDVAQLSLQQASEIWKLKNSFNKWFEGIHKMLTTTLNDGGHVPGLKMVQGNNVRSWENESNAIILLTSKFKPEQVVKVSALSPSATETLLKENPGKATDEFKAKVDNLVVYRRNKPMMVADTDRRLSIDMATYGEDIVDEFDDLTVKELT